MSKQRPSWPIKSTLRSEKGAHLPLMQEIVNQLKGYGWEGRDLFGIELAMEEALSNAIRHGNQYDLSKTVQVAGEINEALFKLLICDEGEGFQEKNIPDPTDEEHLGSDGGRGVMLIKAYMDRVEYNRCGNCLTIEKKRQITPKSKSS